MSLSRYLLRLLLLLALFGNLLTARQALADPWTDDFERICSFTDSAPELPKEQLLALIAESDALLTAPPDTGDRQRKVKIFRLRKCRNLFRYMLDMRATESEGKPQS